MAGICLNIKILQRIIAMFVVIFALTPCSIKGSLFTSLDIAFERPLNKTKSTQKPNTLCKSEVFSYNRAESNTTETATNIPEEAVTTPVIAPSFKNVALKQYAKQTSGNSPPLYILYKRLKFDLA